MGEWLGKIWSRASRIDDEGDPIFLCDGAYGVKIGDLEGGVRNGLTKESACFIIDRVGELLRILRVNKADFDSNSGEDVIELRVTPSVKIAGGDDVVAGLGKVYDGIEDGSSS